MIVSPNRLPLVIAPNVISISSWDDLSSLFDADAQAFKDSSPFDYLNLLAAAFGLWNIEPEPNVVVIAGLLKSKMLAPLEVF